MVTITSVIFIFFQMVHYFSCKIINSPGVMSRGVTKACGTWGKKQNDAPLFFCLHIFAKRLTPRKLAWQKVTSKKEKKGKKKKGFHISYTF